MRFSVKSKILAIYIVVIVSSISAVGWFGFNSAKESYISSALLINKSETNALSHEIKGILKSIPNDVKYNANFYALKKLLIWEDLEESREIKKWKTTYIASISDYMISKKIYYKIRILDNSGKEKLVFKYDDVKNRVEQTHPDKLQDKSDRDYFKKAITLKKDDIYISVMNLNIENRKIEKPFVPVVRYSMPLVNENAEVKGVVVLSLKADYILDIIASKDNKDKNYYLLNKDGYYLFDKNSAKRWGFQLGVDKNFKNDYPHVLRHFKGRDETTFIENGKIISMNKIYPDKENNHERFWYLVTTLDESVAFASLSEFINIFFIILTVVLLSGFLFIDGYISKLLKPLSQVTNQLKALSKGEIKKEDIPYNAKDEIGDIVKSTTILTKSFETLRNQAKTIASGNIVQDIKLLGENDKLGLAVTELTNRQNEIIILAQNLALGNFDKGIEVKSGDDKLGFALSSMADILKRDSIKNSNEAYINEGIGDFGDKLVGINDFIKFTSQALSAMSRYVGASSGVLYLYDSTDELLKLTSSFALNKKNEYSKSYKLGESIIGQIGLDKSSYLLENRKIDLKPKEIYTIALVNKDELLGVVQLKSFDSFTYLKKDYLIRITTRFATMLHSLNQNEQIKELLEKSQSAYEELQTQSEELQESNAMMEEQQEQLETQSEELREKNENLQLASQYKSEFLANMSHELRTPLNSIILLSKLLASNSEKNIDEQSAKKASVINKAGNDLLLLINDILDLSKIEAGKMELSLKSVKSNDILEDMRDLFSSIAEDKNLEFGIVDEYKDSFITDRMKLSQILKNLLSNAFKFTKTGKVTLHVTSKDDDLIMTIKDTGIGIPHDKLDSIFEAFKQVDGSISREFGGTGLGLSISKTIAEFINAKIEVQSELGVGTSFKLILKNIENIDEVTLDITPISESNLIESAEFTDKNILIVDDDSRNIFALTSTLENAGAEIFSAFNGKEAIDFLQNEDKIDVILMDIMMPVMDGLEAIMEIRNMQQYKEIPIIVVTAKNMHEEKQKYLDAGANDYLSKPIDNNALMSMIKAWIR